ncbi:MAG: DUF58 domain-containing protein [Curvibacter sp.]|jgi:uncharacterized protein (DUF58 family)|nr:DUF58 domain-containing protein [Curvibacter sp.]
MNGKVARSPSGVERKHTTRNAQRATPNSLLHPLNALRELWRRWWMARLRGSDRHTLTQRNVYILPTRAGLMLAATLLVLLVASINYQLNLGYLLTFLLGGCALVSMHLSHGTLRGLTLVLHPPQAHHAGAPTRLRVTLHNPGKSPRYGIGLRIDGADHAAHWVWCDVPGQGSSDVELTLPGLARGRHPLPLLVAETRFPLGIFRVWTLWRPAAAVLVYPQAETSPPPLPAGQPHSQGAGASRHVASNEFDGVRPYRRGDPLKSIVWKKAAKTEELISRDSLQAQHFQLWLDLQETHGATLEQRLSRLCAWVLQAESQELDYGLRLPGTTLSPAQGETHRQQCLQALALY